jgi:hypothetical protein
MQASSGLRWGVYVDVEGFSSIYDGTQDPPVPPNPARAGWALTNLIRGAYLIWANLYRDEGNRLFVHHLGDGVVIVSDLDVQPFTRPIAIAAGLLQYLLFNDAVGRAGISAGSFADTSGLLPIEVKKAICQEREKEGSCCNSISLPSGAQMSFSPHMGSALTKSVKIHGSGPKGPHLLVDLALKSNIQWDGVQPLETSSKTDVVDWLRSDFPELESVRNCLGIGGVTDADLTERLRRYVRVPPTPPAEWVKGALSLVE